MSDEIGQPVIKFDGKYAGWKCATRRTWIQSYLLNLILAAPLEDDVVELLVFFVKLTILLDRLVVDRTDTIDLDTFDWLEIPDDGLRRSSLGSIDTLARLYIDKKERLLYDRQRCFLPLCTVTSHRTLHIAPGIRQNGPAFVYAQWGLEGLLGDLKSAVRSVRLPAENLANIAQMKAISLASRLHLNVEDLPNPRTGPHTVHSDLPGTVLLPVRVKSAPFVGEEEAEFEIWKDSNGFGGIGVVKKTKWGLIELESGSTVR
ncbi:hypothetical protein JCM5353_007540, partial [Sporobolomyces roseus]